MIEGRTMLYDFLLGAFAYTATMYIEVEEGKEICRYLFQKGSISEVFRFSRLFLIFTGITTVTNSLVNWVLKEIAY
jgi:hypothetical protein